MNAIPFAISTMIWIVGLWAVPMVFALRAPGPNGRSRALPPAALIGFGLVPVVVGAFRWSVTVIKAYASLAGLPPDEKAQVMSRTLDAARGELGLFARASTIAIVILAVAAAALILLRARARAGAAAPDPAPSPARSARPTLIAAAAAIILAALLLVQARPLAAENDTPWPPFVPGARLASAEPPTPDLVGPDEIERAPVVEVHKDRIALDGMAVDDSEKLQDYLRTLRNNFMLLHPGGRFNEMAVIVAERAAPIPRLAGVLWAIRAAGYHKPLFAFTKGEEVMRPALGKMQRVTATGAQVRLIDAATRTDDEDEYEDNDEIPLWKNAPALRAADFPDYDAFARRLVALRRAGQRVIVNVRRPG